MKCHLRRNVADSKKPEHDDHYLLRWLRARNFDVDAAEKMLRESWQWREQWEVESLQTWEPPEVIQKYYPSGLSGFDKEGSPVVVVPFAGLDMWGMMHSVRKSDFIRNTIKMLETYLRIAGEQVKQHGQQASKVVLVVDMENFNLRQYAWRPAGELVVVILQMYEANYPEILKAAYIINVSKVFFIAFNIVKNFLKEYTLSKIQIYKNNPAKWKPVLLNQIPADQLPAYYGGTMTDPDGDPKCPSKVKPGGKVPKSMYYKKPENTVNSEKFTTVVVKKGDKLKIPFLVAEENTLLKWEFRSENHDIKFGILCTDMDGKETEAVPLQRVTSQQMDEIGMITCQGPATYTVIFDNSYSIMRNKTVHYSVGLFSPEEAKVEDTDLQEG
ncbi:SEC14-like protein 2 isoform X2 [Anabrus simplex]|uniref:SEC14-like protein 2 isoform X2 n=1 Tax=Anabrus simplex TaxID=316456 RepID=UPI0035A28C2C